MNRSREESPCEDMKNVELQLVNMTPEDKERRGEEEEKCLISLMRSQDPAGLRVLIRKYHDKLFSLANRICNNQADSEEVLQDVYMIALNKIDKFQERSTLSTWLYRITVNASLMKLRSQRFSRNTVTTESLGSAQKEEGTPLRLEGEARSPDDVLLSKELCDQIQDSVKNLPEAYQDVFFLRDIQGFSIKETSEILETTPAAIKSRLHRSRFFLQDRLRPYLAEN